MLLIKRLEYIFFDLIFGLGDESPAKKKFPWAKTDYDKLEDCTKESLITKLSMKKQREAAEATTENEEGNCKDANDRKTLQEKETCENNEETRKGERNTNINEFSVIEQFQGWMSEEKFTETLRKLNWRCGNQLGIVQSYMQPK